MSHTVPIEQAAAKLAELIGRLKPGDEIVLTEHDRPVARIVPNQPSRTRRQPGNCKGMLIVEQRLDGSMHIRFKGRYLEFKDLTGGKDGCLGAPPPNPRSLPNAPIPAEAEEKKAKGRAAGTARPSAVHRSAGSSGRTPALPGPSGGKSCGSGKDAYRPAPSHPWRTPFAGKRR